MAKQSPDRKIADDVRQALERDSRLHHEGISVRVKGGVVTLSGTVSRYSDRMVAAEGAWRTRGVAEVQNRIQVRPERPRNAVEVAADIYDALSRDGGVDLRGLVVEVAEGIVRVSGVVSTDAERKAVEEIARGVEGVEDISNELTVSAEGRRPDSEIEQDVRSALNEDARIADATRIRVRSVAGTVRLEGVVANAGERETAQKDAWYTGGVVYVENLLRVEERREKRAA